VGSARVVNGRAHEGAWFAQGRAAGEVITVSFGDANRVSPQTGRAERDLS